ncbi:hypothetical protein ACFUGD_01395 [Streptomyces sp. NPDC057217]|uniref:hypothetical protein n=1 Tax=Streptomyces sp. NPDC057217 TaxID=3346054 RepID=UPI0036268FDF
MPQFDDYGQDVSFPVLSDPPNIETALDGVVNGLAKRVVMRFADSNARAATLTGPTAPVAGMVTYLVSEDRLEIRMGDGTWQALTPGPWIPLTFASGYVARTGSPAYRVVNGSVELRGTFQRTSGAAFTKGATFTPLVLPSGARPSTYRYFIARTEWAADLYASVEVAPDGSINVGIPNSTGTAAAWMSLDSIRFTLS